MKKGQLEIAEVLLDMGVDLDVIEVITSLSSLEYCKEALKKQIDKKHV